LILTDKRVVRPLPTLGLIFRHLRLGDKLAEVVDWALALVAVGADGLSSAALRKTLGALLKNREDVERVLAEPSRFRG
jgi:hypothetical protein